MGTIYDGVIDTSFNVDAAGTVPTDVSAAGTAGNDTTAADGGWGGFFRNLGGQLATAAINKDAALTQAEVNRRTQVRPLPTGQYVPASVGGLSTGTLLLLGAALVGGVLLVKLAK